MKMNCIFQKNRFGAIIETVYKLVLLLLAFLNFNTYTYGTPLRSGFVLLTTALSGLFLLTRLVDYKQYIKNCVLWILIAFMGSYLITMFVNAEYGLIPPLKTLIWMAMHFLLLYATPSDKTDEELQQDTRLILALFSLVTFVSVCISLGQLVANYGGIRYHEDATGRISLLYGFIWGRLWGVYYDPNYGSVFAVLSVLIACYFMHIYRTLVVRIAAIAQIVIQLLYIIFSDSRTGLVAGAAAFAVFVYCRLISVKDKFAKKIKRVAPVLGGVATVVALVFVLTAVKFGYNTIMIHIMPPTNEVQEEEPDIEEEEDQPGISSETEDPQKEEDQKKKPQQPSFLLGREGDLDGNISNNRFDLWYSAVETFALRPLFGVPFNHVVAFSQEYCPNTFLINNGRGIFNNYHNAFFNVLVGQGTLGAVLLLTIIGICVVRTFKKLSVKLLSQENVFYAMAFAIVVAVFASSMFVTELVYTNSPATVLFWIMLGVLTHQSKKEGTHE